jgi:hypothetical protein
MSTHTTTRPGRQVTQRAAGHHYRDHTVTGTATVLADLVATHRNAGTLISVTTPRPVGDRLQVVIRIRDLQPSRPAVPIVAVDDHIRTRIGGSRRRTRVAAIVAAVTGTLTGLAAAAAYLIGQLVELVAAHAGLILGVLALAAILTGLLARASGRRHCPGC